MYVAGLEQKWTEQEIGDLRRQGRWAEVMAKLDRRIDAAPDDTMARVLAPTPAPNKDNGPRRSTNSKPRSSSTRATTRKPCTSSPWLIWRPGKTRNTGDLRRMLLKVPIEFDAAPSVVGACWVAPEAVNDLTVVAATAAMLHRARVATNARLKKPRVVAETQSDLGRTLYRVGNFDEAVQQLEEAVKMQARGDFSTFFDLAFLAMAQLLWPPGRSQSATGSGQEGARESRCPRCNAGPVARSGRRRSRAQGSRVACAARQSGVEAHNTVSLAHASSWANHVASTPQLGALSFSFLAARALRRSALAAFASGAVALLKRSLSRTALPERSRR